TDHRLRPAMSFLPLFQPPDATVNFHYSYESFVQRSAGLSTGAATVRDAVARANGPSLSRASRRRAPGSAPVARSAGERRLGAAARCDGGGRAAIAQTAEATLDPQVSALPAARLQGGRLRRARPRCGRSTRQGRGARRQDMETA